MTEAPTGDLLTLAERTDAGWKGRLHGARGAFAVCDRREIDLTAGSAEGVVVPYHVAVRVGDGIQAPAKDVPPTWLVPEPSSHGRYQDTVPSFAVIFKIPSQMFDALNFSNLVE